MEPEMERSHNQEKNVFKTTFRKQTTLAYLNVFAE